MLVGVIGNLHGIAPGIEANLSWGPVLTQSELSARPAEWLRAGVAAQRNRALSSPRMAQWGPLVASLEVDL